MGRAYKRGEVSYSTEGEEGGKNRLAYSNPREKRQGDGVRGYGVRRPQSKKGAPTRTPGAGGEL